MDETIELLEAEIDSLKDAYKHCNNEDEKTIYSVKILSHKKALNILKQIS